MNNITDFINSLLPSLKKREIQNDCDLMVDSLRHNVLVAYGEAVPYFKGYTFKDARLKEMETYFRKEHKDFGRLNMVEYIAKELPTLITNMESVQHLIKDSFGDFIEREGMTYFKTNLIQLSIAGTFVSQYALRFLNYIYLLESKAIDPNGDTPSPAEGLRQPIVDWLEENFVPFADTFGQLTCQNHVLKESLKKIPEVIVSANTIGTLHETIGMDKLQPLTNNFISPRWNPFYHIGLAIAEYQVKRYKEQHEELIVCRLRLMNLEQLQKKEPSPALQKQIDTVQERINGLVYSQQKMEKSYA